MFPSEEAWMINPQKTRRRKARRLRKGGVAMARRRKSSRKRAKVVVINNPRKRRRSHRRRRSAVAVMNSPRRRHRRHRINPRRSHRRSFRRNPGLPTTGFVMDAVYVTGGFFATRLAAGTVLPMLGTMADQPLVRIAGKGVVAWGLGWVGGKFLGSRQGQLLMLGGLVEVLSDAVKTYVSPYVPALAGGEVSSYPSLISSYPTMGGDYSNPYSVSMGAGYSEHDE